MCLFLRQSHYAAQYTCLYACLCLPRAWIKVMCRYTWLSGVTGTCPPGPAFPLYSLPLGWRGLTEKPSCCPQHGDNKATVGLQVPSVVCSWQGMRLEGGWRSLPVCFVNICMSAHPHGPLEAPGCHSSPRNGGTGWDGMGWEGS